MTLGSHHLSGHLAFCRCAYCDFNIFFGSRFWFLGWIGSRGGDVGSIVRLANTHVWQALNTAHGTDQSRDMLAKWERSFVFDAEALAGTGNAYLWLLACLRAAWERELAKRTLFEPLLRAGPLESYQPFSSGYFHLEQRSSSQTLCRVPHQRRSNQ